MKSILTRGMFAFSLLAITSCNQLPEGERTEMVQQLTETYQLLGKLHEKARTAKPPLEEGRWCDAARDSMAHVGTIPVLHIDELRKFTLTDPEAFKEAQKAWNDPNPLNGGNPWVFASNVRYELDDHFNKLPTEMSDKELKDNTYMLTSETYGTFQAKRWIVIVPDADAENVNPKIVDEEEFESGYFKGALLLISYPEMEGLCAVPFEVTSSEEVGYTEYSGRRGKLLNTFTKSPQGALDADFREAFQEAIQRKFRGYELSLAGHMN